MDEITTGQRLVVFKSAADAREAVPLLADRMDILGYNLEHGPANPADEQADPIAGVKVMQELAHQYGLKLAMGPDHDFAVQYGAALAPYVDMFVLQVQRVQTDPETVRAFVVPLAEELRKANPDIQISVQVRTEGDVEQIADLLESLLGSIDGVSDPHQPGNGGYRQRLGARDTLTCRAASPANPDQGQQLNAGAYPQCVGRRVDDANRAGEDLRSCRRNPCSRLPRSLYLLSRHRRMAKVVTLAQPTVAAVVALPPAAPAVIPDGPQRFLLPLAGLMTVVAIVGGVVGALVVLFYRHKP